MKDDDKGRPEADFLFELCNVQGAACATVSDGHIILFKRKTLQDLLDKNPHEMLTIFLKRPTLASN